MEATSPTSPAMPTFPPRSPQSPMDMDINVDYDGDKVMTSALPQLLTSFSPDQTIPHCKQASFSASLTTPRSAVNPAPWRRSNGSTCRRNSLASPAMSPAQAAFTPMSPALSSFPIRTPERAFISRDQEPTSVSLSQDGRQSRMAMRGPGFGTTLTLPLRVNTNLSNVQEEESVCSENTSSPASSTSSTSLIDWPPSFPVTVNASPSLHQSKSRRLVRSHTPAPIATRSPIRKHPKLSRFPGAVRLPPPPKYHLTVVPSESPRTRRGKEQYAHSVDHLRAPLVPLISVSTGLPHPQFPTSLLQYHLLTHDQLDSLARWYHQVAPAVEETFQYPAWIPPWTSLHPRRSSTNADTGEDTDLETKRRRWGRFIGLRGCESPVIETNESADPQKTESTKERPEELARRMEREWRRALERAEEESRAFEKSWRGRW